MRYAVIQDTSKTGLRLYERARAEVDNARKTMDQGDFLALWEERNDQLRNLGIKLIPLE